jgi:dihydrofolate synthase / folylpolyglutamate synthase
MVAPVENIISDEQPMDIDSLLTPLQQFGVHLGLDRIQKLLSNLGNPHHQVPIIHVAGTNGKGSVCAYLSAILTEAGYRTGRYTSPHLVDWTERICLNSQPIESPELYQLLQQVQTAIPPETTPTQFEVITAAAWLYFAQQQVDIAVIEVGLGGRLDATNVCDHPLATIITSISLDHTQQLGTTIAEIAAEKAGILKPQCPAVIAPLPIEAEAVVRSRLQELQCPSIFPEPAKLIETGFAEFKSLKYPLPLVGEIQLTNSACAIATILHLQQKGWQIPDQAIINGIAKTQWPGRMQLTTWKNHQILIDGAHNPAAAQALRNYLHTPITWIIGMLSTKDHAEIFKTLLKSGDRLYLVPVSNPNTANPEELAILAKNICPELRDCQTYENLTLALNALPEKERVVLCGSLYLVGEFLNAKDR